MWSGICMPYPRCKQHPKLPGRARVPTRVRCRLFCPCSHTGEYAAIDCAVSTTALTACAELANARSMPSSAQLTSAMCQAAHPILSLKSRQFIAHREQAHARCSSARPRSGTQTARPRWPAARRSASLAGPAPRAPRAPRALRAPAAPPPAAAPRAPSAGTAAADAQADQPLAERYRISQFRYMRMKSFRMLSQARSCRP